MIITWYLLFAVVTAIVGHIYIFWPAIDTVRVTHPEDPVAEHWVITSIVTFIFSIIFAPFIFWIYFSENRTKHFRESFTKNLLGY